MYTIEVDYRTGNSFNTEEIVGERIGLCWESKDLARQALLSIREHYALFQEQNKCNSFRPTRGIDDIFKEVKAKQWYRVSKDDTWLKRPENWYCSCQVLMDNGEYRNVPTSTWCGYFEKLHSARVVCEMDDEDKVTFH